MLIPFALPGACARSLASQPPVSGRCIQVGGPQDISVPIPPLATAGVAHSSGGIVRVVIQERGVSLLITLDDAPATASESPLERLGTLVLTLEAAHAAGSHTLKIHSEDSPSMTGEACFSFDRIPASEPGQIAAAKDMEAAGRAVHGRNWTAAFDAYLAASRRFDALRLHAWSGTARQALAELTYRRLDRKRDAYALAGQALSDYEAGPQPADPVLLGVAAGLQAKALMDMPGGNTRASAPEIRRRIAMAHRNDAKRAYGARELPRLDILTGFLEYLLDSPPAARGWFAQAATRCRELRDWECYAAAIQNLAQLQESSDYALALSTYAEALRYLRPEIAPKLVADIWMNLGRLEGVVGLFSSSERSQLAAMRTFRELGDCRGVRMSLSRIGRLLVQIGGLADGENNLQRAATADCSELVGVQPAAPRPADSTSERGSVIASSRVSSARAARERFCEHPLDPQTSTLENRAIVFNSLESLAEALTLEGDVSVAQTCLAAAEVYAEDSRSKVRLANARAAILLDRNLADEARAEFERALRVADAGELPATYAHRSSARLGLVKSALLAGNTAEGLAEAYAALPSTVARGDIGQTITSLRLIAAGQRASGNADDAVRTLQTAADLIEAVPIDELDGEQRATFLATQHTAFAELMDVFASESHDNPRAAWSAFEASERGRARSLRYALNQSTRDASSFTAVPPTARYQRLLREVVQIDIRTGPTHDDATRPVDAGIAQTLVRALDAAAQRERSPAEPLDAAQLSTTLRELDATLVEYAVGARDLFAFVINKDGSHVVRLGDSHAVLGAATDLLNLLRDPETPVADIQQAASRLAGGVLWPIEPLLSGRRLLVVPDDALHSTPFAALPWSPDQPQDRLLQHLETTIIPSALFLTRVHSAAAQHRESPRIELIGDPVFRVSDWRRECDRAASSPTTTNARVRAVSDWTESLPRLPGTRMEVSAIARIARELRPGSRVDARVGCAAVPAALRRVAIGDIDLLHIATHARIDAQRPRLSALALTPAPGESTPSAFGLLDILGLKLHSRLVVLSACETSRGRLLPGEGVLGPAQAFLQAGAAAVLASYWRVDDELTSAFMQQFYRNLLAGDLSASAALRKTQLESAASAKNYAWAAFALYGWPDSSL
jgi:CHAT domain-containing protein/tetratricopeptide (TPR) repeat protein